MRSKAHAEHAAPSKSDAVRKHVFKMFDGNRLAFRDTIDVGELREDVADMILRQKLLGAGDIKVRWRRVLAWHTTPGPVICLQH